MILFVFFTLSFGKCGLWYQFSHTSTSDGPYTARPSCGGCYSTYGWSNSYGYESLDQNIMCNDLEMFNQCNRAQQILDLYATRNNLPFVTIGCANHIVCAPSLPGGNGRFWCQNMDSYDLCLFAKNVIELVNQSSIYQINCQKAAILTDNIPVLEYREASPTTTTTTITTLYMNTTTVITIPPNTTAPASGITLLVPLKLIIISIFL